jgi:hypothetical protein
MNVCRLRASTPAGAQLHEHGYVEVINRQTAPSKKDGKRPFHPWRSRSQPVFSNTLPMPNLVDRIGRRSCVESLEIRRGLSHVSRMEKTIAMSMVVVLATFCGAYAPHVWKR